MPTKRRAAKGRAHRITREALDAFRAGDRLTLHYALGLRPWQPSPLDADTPVPPAWAALGPWRDSWALACDLRGKLHAATFPCYSDLIAKGTGMFGILRKILGGKAAEKVTPRKAPDPDRIRRLSGDGDFSVKVAGTSNYQDAITRTKRALGTNHSGDFLVSLVPDPENKYDANAIKVVHKSNVLGFIPGNQTGGIHEALSEADASECKVMARIVGHGKATLGLRLNIAQPPRIA